MQLTPERSVSIVFDHANPNQVALSVSGVGPRAPGSQSQALLGGSETTAAPNTVEVSVEEKMAGVPDRFLGWSQPNPQYTVKLTASGTNPTVWSGTVTLPAQRGSKQMRLLIREFENFTADAGQGRRIVFAEAVEV